MDIPELSEDDLKITAVLQAMSSVLASVYCENALLREILKQHGLLTDDERVRQLRQFSATKWKQYENDIHAKILELARKYREKNRSRRVQ
jgi:hypothetical protein